MKHSFFCFVLCFIISDYVNGQITAGAGGLNIITGYSDSSFSYNYGSLGQFTGNCVLDMDHDSVFDFNFYAYNTNSGTSGGYPERGLKVSSSHQVMVNASGYPQALASGAVIDSSKMWSTTSSGILQKVISFSTGTGTFGEWCPNDAYLGIRLNYPGDTLYGYIYLHVPMTLANYTVMNYGYEKPKVNVGVGSEIPSISKNALYPNPFNDRLYVPTRTTKMIQVIMYDMYSKIVLDQLTEESEFLNTEEIKPGLYIYELMKEKQVIYRGKLVKQ